MPLMGTPTATDDLLDLRDLPSAANPNDIVKAFAANPAFRAAEWEELTTENNPYRRPVRPADLAWLDYSRPMPEVKALRLSALLGHRMLRNIYDAEFHHLPAVLDDANKTDRATFHSTRNRILGALARPVLERHLFTLLEEVRPPFDPGAADTGADVAALAGEVASAYERRLAEPGAAFLAARQTKHRRESTTFLLLQLSAFRPAGWAALGRLTLGEYHSAHPDLRPLLHERYHRVLTGASHYRDLLAAAELTPVVGAYWQLYLGSSLGRGNHLLRLASAPEEFFALLGALVHDLIDQAAIAGPVAQVAAEGLGHHGPRLAAEELTPTGAADLVHRILGPLRERFGAGVTRDFHRGFHDASWFAALWDRDLAEQLSWADRIEEFQEKAEKIDQHLTNENITVDLDTFVETNEETSTTHVHNEHRLVMIESGQMHFWNNTTHKIELNEGDKLLIPVSRLHGSTVLSGSCTYHQPIIPDEMLQQFL
jgi:mannose-6-phosphate isomerase-like protein (cupin superfamily)